MTRDEIWIYLYNHRDLRKMSRKLVSTDLSEDLLSEAIIHLFNRKSLSDLNAINENGKLPAYTYQIMYSFAYNNMAKFNKLYSHLDNTVEISPYLSDSDEHIEGLDITEDDAYYASRIFGHVSDTSVKLMRQIDDADSKKESNFMRWNDAQSVKLYLESGSYRKANERSGIATKTIHNNVKRFINTMKQTKKSICIVTNSDSPTTGMELYRLFYPYSTINTEFKDEYQVNGISLNYLYNTEEPELADDIYVFSRLFNKSIADKIKAAGKKIVIDVDDYWKLDKGHPLHNTESANKYHLGLLECLPLADLITTTTVTLQQHIIEELGLNAIVIKNTIPDHQQQFIKGTYPHHRVRFGWIGGVHHFPDIFPLYESFGRVYKDPSLCSKIQFCLGGFNLSAFKNNMPEFVKLERIFTNDYRFSPAYYDYSEYLQTYTPLIDHVGYDMPYRRLWAKDVNHYGEMYRQIDVSLIPLNDTPFNACKSELKLVEAGYTGKAIICSNVAPYAEHLEDEENCLAVNRSGDWSINIRKFVNDQDLRAECAKNLSNYVAKKFNHKKEVNKLTTAISKL